MGEVIIELPLEVRRRFRITDAKAAAEVLEALENLEKTANRPMQVDPRGNIRPFRGRTDDTDEVLGVWADRKESPDEIARQLRQGNRQHG